jgi:hypothetical protein
MKPLNRPMFRYGGPIKEGVMSGIREPKKNGGLSKQFNTGLVGDERYPKTDGREHHYFFLPAMGMAALRMLAPRAIAAGVKQFGRGLATSPGAGTSVFGKGLTKMDRLKNLLPSGRFRDAGSKINLGGKNPNNLPVPYGATMDATGKLSFRQALTDPKRLGMAIRENPFTAFGAAGQIKNIPDIAGGALDVGKKVVQGGTNYLLGTEFGKNKTPEIDPNADPNLGKTIKELATSTGTGKGVGEGVALSSKELRQKNIDKYRDIVDIKGMNKEAAYNSLIAASRAINESGDFKGDIKSGKLINQIIQGASKSFDKPKQTKDAIDTLILKGEIEKDINKESNALKNEAARTTIALNKKKLEGNNFAENKAVLKKAGGSGQSGIDDAAGLNNEDFRGNLILKTDIDKVIKGQKEKGILDEREVVVSYTNTLIEGKELPDGDYTVGDYLVTIQSGKVYDIER